jgi:DNA-binding transcriptional regulator YiaG
VTIGVPEQTTVDLAAVARARRLAKSGAGRAMRVAARVSIRDVAHAVGTSTSVVWRWKKGQRLPRAEFAVRWVRVLDGLDGR